MLRDEIQRQAQRHCDASFAALPGGYSAWSSMDTLVSRGLVARRGGARAGPVAGARRWAAGLRVWLAYKWLLVSENWWDQGKLTCLISPGGTPGWALSEMCGCRCKGGSVLQHTRMLRAPWVGLCILLLPAFTGTSTS